MTYKQILFSFKGRINRRTFWLKAIVPLMVIDLSYLTVFIHVFRLRMILSNPVEKTDPQLLEFLSSLSLLVAVAILPILFFTVWISLAAGTKRLHDRNMSGWWQLVSLIPYLGNVWSIVIGILKGQKGNNKYGPPPAVENE